MRIDELSLQQERNPSSVSQLVTQILDLQNKAKSMSQRAGLWHPRSQPTLEYSESQRSGLLLDTRNSIGTSGNVCESLPAREGPSSALFENSQNLASSSCGLGSGRQTEAGKNYGAWKRGETRSAEQFFNANSAF